MYWLRALFAVAVCLTSAGIANALAFTNWPAIMVAGEANIISWTGTDLEADTTIVLRKGSAGDLRNIKTITTSARGGTYTWTPDTALEEGKDYALEISQAGQINYSGYFTIANSRNEIPPSVGPPPARFDPNSPEFDTSPKDGFGTGVEKGNDGETVTMSAMNGEPTTVDVAPGKSATLAQAQTSRASLRNTSIYSALGGVAALLCVIG